MDHHYLPQFYLRQWTEKRGRMVRYRWVASGRIAEDKASPRGTAFEEDLYATPPAVPWDTHDPQIIETAFMSQIDNDAALVLQKLVSDAPGIGLTSTERTSWALFLNSLIHRHRDEILERDALAPQAARTVVGKLSARATDDASRARLAKALEGVDIDQIARTAHRTLMVQAIKNPAATAAIDRLAWQTLSVDPSNPLITTDRPLLVNLGMTKRNVELITIALSPTRLFVAHPGEWLTPGGMFVDGAKEILGMIAFAHDLFLLEQPCRYVFASRRIHDEQFVGDNQIRIRTAVEQALKQWAKTIR